MEKIELGTPDGAVENFEKIAKLFPQVVTEVENTDCLFQARAFN